MKLNLGACDSNVPGFVGVDIAPPADEIADLAGPWPWASDTVDEVLAFDVIEHIGDCDHQLHVCTRCAIFDTSWRELRRGVEPSRYRTRHPLGRIHFLNELHRVLKPGARATIETPNAAHGAGYFQDLQHCSPFCLNSFQYVEAGSFAHNRLAKSYGITAAFRIISLTERAYMDAREEVFKITAILEAVK